MPERRRFVSPALIFLSLGDVVIVTLCTLLALRFEWPAWLAYITAINLVTLLGYAYDKSAAHAQWTRIPEWVLHFFALLGGSPAALLGQRLFRHKTVKRSFRIWFWIIVAAQIVVAGLLAFLATRGPR